ncbi:MAG: homoserine O-acetyltransferase [Bacteroidales bacterium]
MTKFYKHPSPLKLEMGAVLPSVDIAYHTWGKLNEKKDNVIWVCHAFTANSDVKDWWPDIVGSGLAIDTDKYFVVCANILGSCYGTTGAMSTNPDTGKPWFADFPRITIRDLINCHEILREQLGINTIRAVIGGSVGGQQAVEYAIMCPDVVKSALVGACSAKQTPWAIAFNETMRMAIKSDSTYADNTPEGGLQGLKTARAIALLSYRNEHTYNTTQKDENDDELLYHRACSYQQYQGEKLIKRYDAYTYMTMTYLADSHNVGRSRGGVKKALKSIKIPVMVMGVDTDLLYPIETQKYMSRLIPNSKFYEVESQFGHDGFLIETDKIGLLIKGFIS